LSKKKIVPILVFFGSQEAVKKFGPKIGFSLNWSSHPSGIPTVFEGTEGTEGTEGNKLVPCSFKSTCTARIKKGSG
jgi:hypothetical protein